MKIRNGFVSNSSSSSFIVAFDERPTGPGEIQCLLFGDKKYHEGHETWKIANSIFDRIADYDFLKRIPEKAIFAAECGADAYRIAERCLDHNDPNYYDIVEYIEDIAEFYDDDFMKENAEKFLCRFHFSDHDSEYDGMLEHSDIFHNLPNLRISHH